jgi:hypothetical protein
MLNDGVAVLRSRRGLASASKRGYSGLPTGWRVTACLSRSLTRSGSSSVPSSRAACLNLSRLRQITVHVLLAAMLLDALHAPLGGDERALDRVGVDVGSSPSSL